jgi:lipoate---protein ligase
LCHILKKVKIHISTSHDVYANLALEEYLVTQSNDDILLFYINSPCVVIGKHQNPWKEVDLTLRNEKKHTVARRLSGGGTVYHDLGNINFSFIRNKNQDFVNFREHIVPISAALEKLGISNVISPRNDIFVKEHKVSGNAEHVNSKLGRILHHGTLLYDSDIIRLNGSIRPQKNYKIKTHAVDSVRSPVMNMREVIDHGETSLFLNTLINQLQTILVVDQIEFIDPFTMTNVSALITEKYITWDWNFGHTPQFEFTDDAGNLFKIRKGRVLESENPSLIGSTFESLLL